MISGFVTDRISYRTEWFRIHSSSLSTWWIVTFICLHLYSMPPFSLATLIFGSFYFSEIYFNFPCRHFTVPYSPLLLPTGQPWNQMIGFLYQCIWRAFDERSTMRTTSPAFSTALSPKFAPYLTTAPPYNYSTTIKWFTSQLNILSGLFAFTSLEKVPRHGLLMHCYLFFWGLWFSQFDGIFSWRPNYRWLAENSRPLSAVGDLWIWDLFHKHI